MSSHTSHAPQASSTPLTRQPVPYPKACLYTLFARVIRVLSKLDFAIRKWRNWEFWSLQEPDVIKTYPVCPTLKNRIFIPKSHHAGERHAVFILMHGGGWVLGDPSMDDAQARMLADQHGFVVASLEYRLAPRYRFPTAILDVAALTAAVLDDSELPIDARQLVVGGFSTGAVMTLNLAQLPELKHRIKALVAFQPLTDRSGEARGPWKTTEWGAVDQLKYTMSMFDWAYTPVGVDMRNKLLSPLYATRDDIAQPLFIITGEADTLCEEASLLAKKLAGKENDGDATAPWEENGVRYYCAPDMPHCWTHFWVVLEGQWRTKQIETTEEAWRQVTSWLKDILSGKDN